MSRQKGPGGEGAKRIEPRRRQYTIELTPAAAKRLDQLPKADFARLDAKIRALADDPHPPGSEKLAGTDNLYRIRAGDYRAIDTIEHGRLVVAVVKVAHRRDAYRH